MERRRYWSGILIPTLFSGGLIIIASMVVHAQFAPVKGANVSTWKEPEGGFCRYWWLKDNELVYIQNPNSNYQFVEHNLTTGTEHPLEALTNTAHKTQANYSPGALIPSPDGKHVAWIPDCVDGEIIVSTLGGVVVSKHSASEMICYPSWTEDSKWCMYFTLGTVHGSVRISASETWDITTEVYTKVSAISAYSPSLINTYPIPPYNALCGSTRSTEDIVLPFLHFKGKDRAVFSAFQPREIPAGGRLDLSEYSVFNSGTITTYSIKLPEARKITDAVISPNGNYVALLLTNETDQEIWISSMNGKHMRKLGQLLPGNRVDPDKEDAISEMRWLPSGRGISFREAGKLYVVYLDSSKSSR